MDCKIELISAYIDGELEPQAEAAVEKHLLSCQDCMSELNSQKRLVNALSELFASKNKDLVAESFSDYLMCRTTSTVKGFRGNLLSLILLVSGILIVSLLLFDFIFTWPVTGQTVLAEVVLNVFGLILHLAFDAAQSITVLTKLIAASYFGGLANFLLFSLFIICILLFGRSRLFNRGR